MSLTPSEMLPLGTIAPDFTLPECEGGEVSLDQLMADHKALVVMFICNHCPFVIHIEEELVRLADDFQPQGVAFVAINSNDVTTYEEDSVPEMVKRKQARGYAFPYCVDASQTVAKAYQAACTPDFYVFDANRACVYRGRLDDSRPGNDVPVTGLDLRAALKALLAGDTIDKVQHPSMGCNIKWKPNVEGATE